MRLSTFAKTKARPIYHSAFQVNNSQPTEEPFKEVLSGSKMPIYNQSNRVDRNDQPASSKATSIFINFVDAKVSDSKNKVSSSGNDGLDYGKKLSTLGDT